MLRIRLIGIIGVITVAMCFVATAAFALPDISITLGGAYPLHLNFADNGATSTRLESGSGTQLEGRGVSILLFNGQINSVRNVPGGLFKHRPSGHNLQQCG